MECCPLMWAVSILARDPLAVSNSQVWRWNLSRPVCFGIAQVEGELSNRKLGVISLRSELSSSGDRKCYYLCLRTPMQLPPPPPPSPTPPLEVGIVWDWGLRRCMQNVVTDMSGVELLAFPFPLFCAHCRDLAQMPG
ncbi:hypothetical protein K456DRAFT_49899 [Colletotrichum gloeosporioides 23]|nr:hypothetical protein K456DRAFT_49899 [Colletotrichum gloeosporioides 23]